MRVLIATLLVTLSSPAQAEEKHAAPATDGNPPAQVNAKDAARAHNLTAKRLFNLGKFDQAVEAYQKAYKALPLPEFLYNLGQCHQRMEGAAHLERAKFFFEGYLTNKPDATNRAEVEQEIKEIQHTLDTMRRLPRPVLLVPQEGNPSLAASAEPTPWYKSWWLWTIVGAAVAGGATAAVLLTRPEDPVPVEGSLWPRTIELELGW